eukprot:Lithocolla_globosa_v1_NODE_585_length_3676_cov_22.132560.p1 type:complete len:615 gc:universal NODE_585_length_3676_cov_22.132560:395-2239(+)
MLKEKDEVRVLDCGVCLEPFSAVEEKKQPYVFVTCGHSLCKSCADQCSQQSLRCPFDNTVIRPPAVIKNFALIEQLELYGRLLPNSSGVSCEGKHTKPEAAIGYCQDCKKCFCESCSEGIHAILEGHAMLSLSERPTGKTMCLQDHIPCSLYCLQCPESPLICKLCVTEYGSHHGHKAELISVGEERNKKEISELQEKLRGRIDETEKYSKHIHTVIKELGYEKQGKQGDSSDSSLRKAEETINQTFDEAVQNLQQRRKQLLLDLHLLEDNCRQQADKHLGEVGLFLSVAHAANMIAERTLTTNGGEFAALKGDTVSAVQTALATPPLQQLPFSSHVELSWPDIQLWIPEMSVSLLSLPDPPKALDVKILDGEAWLEFSPPENSNSVDSFLVIIQATDNSTTNQVVNMKKQARITCTLNNLNLDQEYKVCVHAINSVGRGIASEVVILKRSKPEYVFSKQCQIQGRPTRFHGISMGHKPVIILPPLDESHSEHFLKLFISSLSSHWFALGIIGTQSPSSDSYNDSTFYGLASRNQHFHLPSGGLPSASGTYVLKVTNNQPNRSAALEWRHAESNWVLQHTVDLNKSPNWFFHINSYDSAQTIDLLPLTEEDRAR